MPPFPLFTLFVSFVLMFLVFGNFYLHISSLIIWHYEEKIFVSFLFLKSVRFPRFDGYGVLHYDIRDDIRQNDVSRGFDLFSASQYAWSGG